MKISIIGQGYVGLTLALFASEFFEVIGFDNNEDLVKQLNLGISHVEGVSSKSLEERINKKRYVASSDSSTLSDVDIAIIAVPTPLTQTREPDLTYILSACQIIASSVKKPILIINESTSFPGTLRNYIKHQIEKYSPVLLNHPYAISPERVDPGRIDFTQKNTPRLYSGLTAEAAKQTKDFYSRFCDNLVEVSSPEVAEAAKLFENTFRQVNIALVNEFAQITRSLGINVFETLEAAGTKPFGFMKFTPSAGVGGHCIPVDPTYLAVAAEQHGVQASFIRRANEVNLRMSEYIVNRIEADHRGDLSGKKIIVVGVAYKANVADIRKPR